MAEKLVLIGAGGHADSVLDVIDEINFRSSVVGDSWEVVKKVDDDAALEELARQYECFHLALGDITKRHKIYYHMSAWNVAFPQIESPKAVISPTALISLGVFVGHNAVVNANARVEKCCIINTGAIIEHGAVIEPFCHIAPGAIVLGGARVGTCSFVGAGAIVPPGRTVPSHTTIKAGSVF